MRSLPGVSARPDDDHRIAGCACGGPEQQTWYLSWTSYALTHGHNPFVTAAAGEMDVWPNVARDLRRHPG